MQMALHETSAISQYHLSQIICSQVSARLDSTGCVDELGRCLFQYVHAADSVVCEVWLTSSDSMPSLMLDAIGLHEFGCALVYSLLTASSGLTYQFLYEFS